MNVPIPGALLYLDALSATDLRFADVQEPGTYLDCPRMRIYRVTDLTGTVRFNIRGAGRNSLPGGAIGPGGVNQVRIVVESTECGRVTLATPDQNGAAVAGTAVNGIDSSDGAFMLYDLFNYSTTAGRSNLNCSDPPAVVDPADLSLFRDYLFNDPASAAPQFTTYCP